MTPVLCDTYEEMSRKACELAVKAIPPDRESLISFPGGDSPVGMVAHFVRMVNSGGVDISRTRYVSLDEWVGLGQNDKGSCGYFNKTSLIDNLARPFLDVHIINGAAEDIEEERKDLDRYIRCYGPLDLSVLGIGLNGHLGFNEDGVDFDLDAHIIPLSKTTKKVMGKYFDSPRDLTRGITQGLRQIMAAGKILLIASGIKKRDILARAFHGPVDRSVPASILQRHPNCFVVCDREAGAGL
ncbi:MAG: glucosamine-6-phosphate deaminase [Spirochaetaceae bacterium]|jgi:glucosamine-6-phosphate deaminase|nr:glucosamine-6-phosphate deaminase [Spirochaetaceae bacterium]